MKRFLLLLTVLSLIGCAHVVSPQLLQRADRKISAAALLNNPNAYKGHIVILGGTIVSSINTNEGAYIEVVQKPLDYRGRPKDTDISHGRFLILHEGYLDTAVYSKGREVTVAGEVIGTKIRTLAEIQYPYLLIKSRELYLFEPGRTLFEIGIWGSF